MRGGISTDPGVIFLRAPELTRKQIVLDAIEDTASCNRNIPLHTYITLPGVTISLGEDTQHAAVLRQNGSHQDYFYGLSGKIE